MNKEKSSGKSKYKTRNDDMNHGIEKKIKVLVVDDSVEVRQELSGHFKEHASIEIIDTAKDCLEAIDKLKYCSPDVVTLDILMPFIHGTQCLIEMKKHFLVPVIITYYHEHPDISLTVEALTMGAFDYLAQPKDLKSQKAKLYKKDLEEVILAASYSNRTTFLEMENAQKTDLFKKVYSPDRKINQIVAIGVSTGGPKALNDLIPCIPENFPAAFLVVQHMPKGFTKTLAERLDKISKIKVKEASDGECIENAHVYFAPGDSHLKIEQVGDHFILKLSSDPPISGLRPCADITMESLARTNIEKVIGVIMTGMGADGSKGLKLLKEKLHAHVIAQDEESCVVFGMPRAAIQAGVVDVVVPLKQIIHEIIKHVEVHV
jgi:two-component system, chemotaxis family, protein-glutamate methylesterase/glutaminase